ncbi:type VI secretion system tube protein Hcp [Paraburkholderia edwinii]|jgi:type VI secretion system secreted protein Hcp|uniref:Type VI secretion system tube protein Hcp n=1 Tax=Paraburkholderia edwinii TaxID=2861782 RepID=A0ABX8URF2_9BURK|nr:type VI secretion system tube protein Hcp [Paraburkholderia edwinii]QYD71366.1 type VI secretion system tube protein Hcp [Paraburkholderia edwinii]
MAFTMHLKFSGGTLKVTGDSVFPGHKNEIQILSWGWGVTNKADLHRSGNSSTGNTAQAGDIQILKNADAASTAIFQGCTDGLRAEDAYISITNNIDFFTVHLSNVAITSVSTSANTGGDHVAEELWLHFSKIEYAFTPQDDQGKAKGGTKTFSYDTKAPKQDS